MEKMKIYHLIHGQNPKNIELIKNFNKWFGLKYEIVFFYNVYGPGQIKNSKMSAVIGIFESQYEKKKP